MLSPRSFAVAIIVATIPVCLFAQPPVDSPPSFFVHHKQVSSEQGPDQKYGSSVALTNGVLVAADEYEHVEVLRQAADGTWALEATIPSPETGIGFGAREALATNGDWIAIGAKLDDTFGSNSGAVHMYKFDGSGWDYRGALSHMTPFGNIVTDQFGMALAMDGDRMVVGSRAENGAGAAGAVHYFQYNGLLDMWIESGFIASEHTSGNSTSKFAESVDISGDYMIVGEHRNNTNGNFAGAAHIYSFYNQCWHLQNVFYGHNADDILGKDVAISGTVAIAGSPFADTDGLNEAGAVTVYELVPFSGGESAWAETAHFAPEGTAQGDWVGSALDIDGSLIAVGVPRDDAFPMNAGAGYFLFDCSAGALTCVSEGYACDAMQNDRLGFDVAVSNGLAAIGATLDDNIYDDAGSVYILGAEDLGFECDLTAPGASAVDLVDVDDTGLSNQDDLTRHTTPDFDVFLPGGGTFSVIEGFLAEAGDALIWYMEGTGDSTIHILSQEDIDAGVVPITFIYPGPVLTDGEYSFCSYVMDEFGNIGETNCLPIVIDNADPVASGAFNSPVLAFADTTLYLDADGEAELLVYPLTNLTATDNIGIDTLFVDLEEYDCSNLNLPVTVTLTAIDLAGNIGTTEFTASVLDITGPVMSVQDLTVYLDESGNVSVSPGEGDANTFDVCGDVEFSWEQAPECVGDIPRYPLTSGTYDDNTSECDDCTTEVGIGFDFNFYGEEYNSLWISSNGLLSFLSDDDYCCEGESLTDGSYEAVIAVIHTDIDPDECDDCGIYYSTQGEAPNREFVVSWHYVSNYEDNEIRHDGQAVLYEGSNVIEVFNGGFSSYLPDGCDDPMTTGISNQDGTEGVGPYEQICDPVAPALFVFTPNTNGGYDMVQCTSDLHFNCSHVGENTVVLVATDESGNASQQELTITVLDEVGPSITQDEHILYLNALGEVEDEDLAGIYTANDICGMDTSYVTHTLSCDEAIGIDDQVFLVEAGEDMMLFVDHDQNLYGFNASTNAVTRIVGDFQGFNSADLMFSDGEGNIVFGEGDEEFIRVDVQTGAVSGEFYSDEDNGIMFDTGNGLGFEDLQSVETVGGVHYALSHDGDGYNVGTGTPLFSFELGSASPETNYYAPFTATLVRMLPYESPEGDDWDWTALAIDAEQQLAYAICDENGLDSGSNEKELWSIDMSSSSFVEASSCPECDVDAFVEYTKEDSAIGVADTITPYVALARGNRQGYFNAITQNSWNGSGPEGTYWKMGPTAEEGSYSSWRAAHDYCAECQVDDTISLWIPQGNFFFDIVTTSWTCCQEGGGFSYSRTLVDAPEYAIEVPTMDGIEHLGRISSAADAMIFYDGSLILGFENGNIGRVSFSDSGLEEEVLVANVASDDFGAVLSGFSPQFSSSIDVTAIDIHGNTSESQLSVLLVDTILPTILAQDTTLFLDGNGLASLTLEELAGDSYDNCGIESLTSDGLDFDCDSKGANPITITAVDNLGNVDSLTVTVTVLDLILPTAVAQDITIYLDAAGAASIDSADLDNGSDHPCGGIVSMDLSQSEFDCSHVGANTVTLTVFDGSGNSATDDANVQVVDTISPSAIAQDLTVQLDASGAGSITAAQVDNGSSDACGIADLSLSQLTFDCTHVGTNSVTLTVTDNNGNLSVAQATITVLDGIDPVLLAQNVTVQLDANGAGSVTAAQIDNGSSDACGIASTLLEENGGTFVESLSFNCSHVGSNEVVILVTDVNGNESETVVTVTVEDNVNPQAVAQDLTVQLDASGAGSITAAQIDNGSSDACGIATTTLSQDSFDCSHVGTNSVTLTVTDNNGNVSTAIATVTVEDNVDPAAIAQNITLQLDASGAASITASQIDNGSSDACGLEGSGAATAVAISASDLFTTANANWPYKITTTTTADPTSNAQQTLDINVTSLPSGGANYRVVKTVPNGNWNNGNPQALSLGQNTISVNAVNFSRTVRIQFSEADIAFDALSVNGTSLYGGVNAEAGLSLSQTDFDCSHVGDNTVTLTVSDVNGNTSTATATVTVEDNVAPEVFTQDLTLQLDASGQASLTAAQIDNGSNDACGIQGSTTSPAQVAYSALMDAGANANWPFVYTATTSSDPSSGDQQTMVVNVTSLPVGGANYRVFKTSANGGAVFGNAQSLSLGQNSISVAGVTFTRAVKLQFSSGAVEFDGLVLNGEEQFVSSESLSNSSIIDAGANANWPHVFTATTSADPSSGNQQTMAVNVTSLPVGGANYRVFKTSANGGSVFGNPQALSLGQNTVSIAGVGFTRAVKLQFSDGDVEFDSFLLNGTEQVISMPGEVSGIVLDQTDFDCSHVGANTVTLTVTDVNGNVASATATVTVQDNVDPQAIAQDLTVQLDATGAGGITVDQVNNGSSDACGIATITVSQESFDCSHVGANEITLTVTDNNGNVSTDIATVTVEDKVDPVAIAQDLTVELDASGAGSITAAQFDNGSSDACGIATMTVSQESFDCTHLGANTVTLTVTDNNGNESTASATITVEDNMAPTVSASGVTVYLDENGSGTLSVASTASGVTDNCSVASLTISVDGGAPAESVDFDCSRVGDGGTEAEILVTDGSGNSTAATAIIIALDTISPVVLTQNLTIQLDVNGAASITAEAVNNGSSDACGIENLALNQTDFDCSHVGTNTVTLTVTDVNGNMASATAMVTVQDNVNPQAVAQDLTVQLDADGAGSITVDQMNNGSSDACGIATTTLSQDSFDCSHVGANSVTLTVTDNNGNVSTDIATVTVEDNVNPQAVAQDLTVQLDANGAGSITAEQMNDGSSDACGVANLALSQTDFDCSHVGANTVTLTVTDNNGNQNTTTATITVEDNVDPSISLEASDMTVECDGNGNSAQLQAWLTDNGGAEASDACGISWSHDFVALSDDCGNTGSALVIFTVQDPNGNSVTTSATFTIEDKTNPSIDLDASNETVECDGAGNGAQLNAWLNSQGGAIASDICGGVVWTNNHSALSDDCGATGSTTVIFTATDDCGLTSTTTATFTIEDTTQPDIDSDPQDVVYQRDGNEAQAFSNWLTNFGGMTSTDVCGGTIQSHNSLGLTDECGSTGTETVTFTSTDDCNNTDTRDATFTVIDEVAPSCPLIDLIDASDSGADMTDNITNDDTPTMRVMFTGVFTQSAESGDVVEFYINSVLTESYTIDQTDVDNGYAEFETGSHPDGSVSFSARHIDGCDQASIFAFLNINIHTTDPVAVTEGLTLYLDANGNASLEPEDLDGGSSDDYNVLDLSADQTAFDCSDLGNNTVTLTATDIAGNIHSSSATVVVVDDIAPSISSTNITVELDEFGSATISPEDVASATDNCSVSSLTLDIDAFDCSNVGDVTVTITAMDQSGNSSTTTANVTVQDNLGPVVEAMTSDDEAEDESAEPELVVVVFTFTADDYAYEGAASVSDGNGDVVGLFSGFPNSTPAPYALSLEPGTYTITLTDSYGDGWSWGMTGEDALVISGGASGSLDFIGGTEASLEFTVEAPVEVEAVDEVAVTFTFTADDYAYEGAASVSDGNGDVVGFFSGFPNSTPADYALDLEPGTYTITLTDSYGDGWSWGMTGEDAVVISGGASGSLDFIGGSEVSLEFTVESPSSEVLPEGITVELGTDGTVSIEPSDVVASATDNCGLAGMSLDISSFDCDDLGTNALVLTVTDVNGNSTSVPAYVTVEDNQAPVVNIFDLEDYTLYAGETCVDAVDLFAAGQPWYEATDNCDIEVSILYDEINDSGVAGCREFDRRWIIEAVDGAGNMSRDTTLQHIVVLDEIAPLVFFDNAPEDVTIELGADCSADIPGAGTPMEFVEVTFTYSIDQYAGEADMTILNDDGDVVEFIDLGGGLSNYELEILFTNGFSNSDGFTVTQTLSLAPGEYSLLLEDEYGDGWVWSSVDGSDALVISGNASGAWDFSGGTEVSGTFTVNEALSLDITASATDNCTSTPGMGDLTYTDSAAEYLCGDAGSFTITRTFSVTASDDCGNETVGQHIQTLTFLDVTAPQITDSEGVDNGETVSESGGSEIFDFISIPNPINLDAEDACGGAVTIEETESFTGFIPTDDIGNYCGTATPAAFLDGDACNGGAPAALVLEGAYFDGEAFTIAEGGVNLVESYYDETLYIEVEVTNADGTGGFIWSADYNEAFNWAQWNGLGRGYKKDCANVLPGSSPWTGWEFFVMQTGGMIGTGIYAGSELSLTHQPMNYYYGLQVGQGANNQNAEYGASAWFYWSGQLVVDGTSQGFMGSSGDIMLDMDCALPWSVQYDYELTDACGNSTAFGYSIEGETGSDVDATVQGGEGHQPFDVSVSGDLKEPIRVTGLMPNPTNDMSQLGFVVSSNMRLRVDLYTMSGELVQELYDGNAMSDVEYLMTIDAEGLNAGMYQIRIASNTYMAVKKLLVTQ